MTINTFLVLCLPLVPLFIPIAFAACAWVYQQMRDSLPEKQRAIIDHVAYLAISYVEQLYSSAGSTNKKDIAMQAAANMFEELNLPFPQALCSAAIEAAVREMNVIQSKYNSPHDADPNPLARNAAHA